MSARSDTAEPGQGILKQGSDRL